MNMHIDTYTCTHTYILHVIYFYKAIVCLLALKISCLLENYIGYFNLISEETKSPAKGYKVAVCDSQLIFKLSQSTFYFLRSVVEDTGETT